MKTTEQLIVIVAILVLVSALLYWAAPGIMLARAMLSLPKQEQCELARSLAKKYCEALQ